MGQPERRVGPDGRPDRTEKPKYYTVTRGSTPFTGPYGAEGTHAAGPPLEEDVVIKVITQRGSSVWGQTVPTDGSPAQRIWFAFRPGKEKGKGKGKGFR